MHFLHVAIARFPQTSQSGSAIKGRGADAADEGAEAAAADEEGVGGGEARREDRAEEA